MYERGDSRQLIQRNAEEIQDLLDESGPRRIDPELWTQIAEAAHRIEKHASGYADYLTSVLPKG